MNPIDLQSPDLQPPGDPSAPSAPVPDVQPDSYPQPQTPVPPPRRIPHLGHALLFTGFAGLLLIGSEAALTYLGKSPAAVVAGVITVQHPQMQILLLVATYFTTLAAAWFFFPLLWHRSFLEGIQWRWQAARFQAGRLIGLGLLLGFMMQVITNFITPPKSMPIDEFFLTPATAWLITLFGTVVAPVFEEICFRGFLVPAIAIAYDWFALPRTDAARARWQTTTSLTLPALLFSAILSSAIFALLHAQQVAHLWAALLGLFSVSLVLTVIRIKTRSVAASVLVHSAYNGFVFLTVLVATGGYRHLDRMTH